MKKYIGFSIIALSLGLASCNDFLDKLPDNRTEANTEEKIEKLLVAAYPTHDHMAFTEYASDNVDDMGENNPNTERFLDEIFSWTDVTETDNQAPESYWMDLYQCIETANMALEGIESMGGATTRTLREAQAEALLCRAYAHFMLVNVFAMHYDSNDASALGVSYVTETEKELNPKYERETVHENYAHIAADIEAALPNVGDSYYTVPKYHFNRNAAYAFATRFYLYYEKYDKAIECANMVLGTNPSSMLRDWAVLNTMPNGTRYQQDPTVNHVILPTLKCNLLLLTSYSLQGVYFGGFSTGHRYSHNAYLGEMETVGGLASLWGGDYSTLAYRVKIYSGTNMNAWSQWRMPYLFEITDPVAQIGYSHTVYSAFTGDEVLLNRAEAYIMKKDYEHACEDMTTWVQNVVGQNYKTFTIDTQTVTDFMASIDYAYTEYEKQKTADDRDTLVIVGNYGTESSPKKHLHPKFEIDEEGSVQESMLQAVLIMRRYETLHEGKRWFDVKRWGIEIPRRLMASDGTPESTKDWLKVDDPRRAIQIPQKVRDAGYQPNPRAGSEPGDDKIVNCIND
ncbi:MAG: RagB/SusD family nutrient uptake outer membrane protein [Prevotella sp.]|nr:RagB/SusD family nutrient uptake outer membrane protein [Prevotella sp.]